MNDKKMYGYDGQEVLTATTLDEFMEEVLESNWMNLGESKKAILDRMDVDLSFPVTAITYKRMGLTSAEDLAKTILEDVVENLDQNYRMGADDPHDITQPMEDASLAFAKVVRKEYTPWNCEECGKVVLARSDFEEETNA